MLLKIALLLSMLIQLGATVIAIGLIRRTRYNVSWILFSIGFVLMAIRRLIDFFSIFDDTKLISDPTVNSWLAVIISIVMFIGVIFIRQIFNLQNRIDQLRKENETRVFSAIIQTEEKAKQSIARELHDGLGPILSSVKMAISAILPNKLDKYNEEIVNQISVAIDEAIVSLKEISNDLSPHLLKNYGLFKALETFAEQLMANSSTSFEFESNIKNRRFDKNFEINMYRIACELINNGNKHANASAILLSVKIDEQNFVIIYSDNGCGFDPKIVSSEAKGMGLYNIQSRIHSLNGTFSIESVKGKKTTITIQVPLYETA